MLHALIISPNRELRQQLEGILKQGAEVAVAKTLADYPSPEEVKRLMRVWTPDIVFLSTDEPSAVEEINSQLKTDFPSVFRVGLSTGDDLATLRAALRWGMRELLASPFTRTALDRIVAEVKRHRELNPPVAAEQNHFCAFVPAKGGVGASTIAANAARALASISDNGVLLADFDLYSGIGGFLFNVEHEFNLCDAAGKCKTLDDDTWRKLIHKSGDLDLLLSSGPAAAVDHHIRDVQLAPVVDFARRNYSVVCADLSDSFDDRSLLVLREASRIFIVTTPELPALRLARLKSLTLQKIDLADRAALVVNRVTRSMDLTVRDIEESVGLPVFATFPSEYADVTNAARTGKAAPKLANSAREFASKILNRKVEKKRFRLIEQLALVPAAYSLK